METPTTTPPTAPPDVPPELVARLAAVGVTISGVNWNAHFQEWEWTIERDRPWNAHATHRLRWPLTMVLSGLVAVAARHAQDAADAAPDHHERTLWNRAG